MIDEFDQVYNFIYRGQLAEEALDSAGRTNTRDEGFDEDAVAARLAISSLDEKHVEQARRMSSVYVVVAAFENSVREMISRTLREEIGDSWWDKCVSEKIRKQSEQRMAAEQKVRWHTQRGAEPINYTMLPNLINIIRQNYAVFEPFIHDVEWASNVFEVVEKSRNVIMHSGHLSGRDIARLGTFIRDWTTQVSV